MDQPSDEFRLDADVSRKTKGQIAAVLSDGCIDPKTYEIDDSYQITSDQDLSAHSVHSTPELLRLIEKDSSIEVEANVMSFKEGKMVRKKLDRKSFIETIKSNESIKKFRLRESGPDNFLLDCDTGDPGRVGSDSISLIGGPFNKQLYIYDYLRMHGLAFQAWNHDPFLKAYVNIIVDFTLGRGFRVDVHCGDETKQKFGQAMWDAFEEANNLQDLMIYCARELCIYGETMTWELPDNQTKIEWQDMKGQESPKAYLPRMRLIDPSAIWEIVTYPEDITRVLYYQWVAPTQYQTYTGSDKGKPVPSTKFIYQQVPADQVDHFKVNSVSNEKRGRSDLFPVLGYAKRLRDSINWNVIGLLKNMAWSIDTKVEGSQTDVDNYISAMNDLGTIPSAGSEFVHTAKITREYLSNVGGKGTQSQAFDWCLSAIAAGLGVPLTWFGTHLSGGQTRASAMVGTDPVKKKLEARQLVYERIIKKWADRLFRRFGLTDLEIEVSFPELISADSSQRLQDLTLAEQQKWISKERAAEIAAKELNITRFDYQQELVDIEREGAMSGPGFNPLTAVGLDKPEGGAGDGTSMGSDEQKKLADNNGF